MLAGKKRVEASGVPSFVATWPYSHGLLPSFEQGEADAFGELGQIEEAGEDTGR